MPVLGALSPFLEPFRGRLSPNVDNVSETMTLRYPHEGPWVVTHPRPGAERAHLATYQSRPKIASIYSTLCVFIDETLRFFEKNTHIVCIYRIDGLNFGRDTFVGYKIRR